MMLLDATPSMAKPVCSLKTASSDFFWKYESAPSKSELQALIDAGENDPCNYETASGVVEYGYRYYNADSGRWPSRDPIEEAGGLNLYGMIGNDPVNFMDVLGLSRSRQECLQEAIDAYLDNAELLEGIGENRIESLFGSIRHGRTAALADLGVGVSRLVRDTSFTIAGSYFVGVGASARAVSVSQRGFAVVARARAIGSASSITRGARIAASARGQANLIAATAGAGYGITVGISGAESFQSGATNTAIEVADLLAGTRIGQLGIALDLTDLARNHIENSGLTDEEASVLVQDILDSVDGTHNSLFDRLSEAAEACADECE